MGVDDTVKKSFLMTVQQLMKPAQTGHNCHLISLLRLQYFSTARATLNLLHALFKEFFVKNYLVESFVLLISEEIIFYVHHYLYN
jgi:hypothetical protein